MIGGNGSHWANCEEAHHDCALFKLREAEEAHREAYEQWQRAERDLALQARRAQLAEAALAEANTKLAILRAQKAKHIKARNRAEAALEEIRKATDEPTTLRISQLRIILARHDAGGEG